MTIADLIARLEKEGPSRELDYEISDALGVDRRECCGRPDQIASDCGQYLIGEQCCGNPNETEPMPYTASIDSALTLVPEGFGYLAGVMGGVNQAVLSHDTKPCVIVSYNDDNNLEPATPAIAICIAALKARAGGVK